MNKAHFFVHHHINNSASGWPSYTLSMINLPGGVKECDCETSLKFLSVSFNSNILPRQYSRPIQSSLLLPLWLLCCGFPVSFSPLFQSFWSSPQPCLSCLNREFICALIKPENSPYSLSLSLNYIWILGEIFSPAKVKFLKFPLSLLLPLITKATEGKFLSLHLCNC